MNAAAIASELFHQVWHDLSKPLPLQWRTRSGRAIDRAKPVSLRANGDNWFEADLIFPPRKSGLELAGQPGACWLGVWCPFTLWVDGRQLFREDRLWKATGPIFDPLVPAIEPGRRYRVVLRVRPMTRATFAQLRPESIQINAMPCVETGVDVAAVGSEVRLAAGAARTARERRQVADAIAQLDLAAARRHDWAAFFASAKQFEQRLAWLAPRIRQMTVHILGYTHIDMDWMWTWRDTVYCIRRDYKAVTDLMAETPGLTFGMSQIPTYQAVQQHDPDVFERVRRFIREGRWENWAGAWVENDLRLSGGEACARQMQAAYDWSRRHLGVAATVHWAPDTFGLPGNLPQLMRLAGQQAVFHSRCNPAGREAGWPAYRWIGDDGSEVLAISSHYKGDQVLPEMLGELLMPPVFEAQQLGLTDSHWMWGMGDHGGGLSRENIALLERFRSHPLLPQFRFSTMRELCAALERQRDRLPCVRGETSQIFEGCYTTHAQMKTYNRHCESALLTAETMAVLAGLDQRMALQEAWTDVLFNQFHDIICGAGVPETYRDAYRRARKALAVADTVTRAATARLSRAKRDQITVVNPLGFDRSATVICTDLPAGTTHVLDADGQRLPVQRDGADAAFVAPALPALGAASYRPVRLPAVVDPPVAVTENREWFTIETSALRCRLSKSSGIIGSCFDKRLGRELVGYGVPRPAPHMAHTTRADLALNVFEIADESPHSVTAWMIHDVRRREALLRAERVELRATGPVFAEFRVTHRFRQSRIVEDIRFYRDRPVIEFCATIDWRETGGPDRGVPQLKVGFATAMSAARAWFEQPFAIAERPADGQEQATQKWADLTGAEFGFTLLNNARYGCDALGGRLRLTLVRNSYDPDPDSDRGRHVVRFAFVPHEPVFDAAACVRAGMEFNQPPVVAAGALARPLAQPFTWAGNPGSVVCTAVKHAADRSGVVARFWEAAGRRCRVRLRAARAATVMDLLERACGLVPRRGGELRLTFRPYEIKTLFFPSDKVSGW